MTAWDDPDNRITRYTAGFAYHFHVRPWEIDLLTLAEFDLLASAADDLAKDR